MGNSLSTKYVVLPVAEFTGDADSNEDKSTYARWPPTQRFLLLVLLLQSIALVSITIIATTVLYTHKAQSCSAWDPFLVYSPARQAVEYQVKIFPDGVETPEKPDTSIYRGFSREADEAWTELYDGGIVKIPRNEALLLPNKTYPIQDEPGYYIGGVDVFHQLHCLDYIRKALHPDPEHYFSHANSLRVKVHTWHCFDSLRESLMCSSDIAINVWQWSDEHSRVLGHTGSAHSCRNFEKIRSWARERQLTKGWIDETLQLDDGLPEPPIIH